MTFVENVGPPIEPYEISSGNLAFLSSIWHTINMDDILVFFIL
ncbi:hypothetical protein APHWI1_1404 [Anaplasma phagocytophilum str. ApWI1]|uniref:Uncharacterized protein n=2 Tax=Anaplasma phagocytophilum TaxID=948 RepID=A0A0F3NEP0_ANAPH|nr:hypothetical protein EPHNCH_0627 [Anaplasma phagocytophilum str. NCH-1]KJV84836.1 hypothetical protein APHWI1_1404 [Anaplasma phagocytophilum str. ApWI1]KJV87951.1 hypothetical protein APHNYW_0358 [Anaplasma phagocytophilum str. ApNYW]KJV99176.1 hypothetical protein OTSANNIE_0601 [Anaplasma phagocytophilum str. Annie]KKA00738.1 hypothetical protein APHCR_1355 [Anaplasma phagocytophilum str. CR1007]